MLPNHHNPTDLRAPPRAVTGRFVVLLLVASFFLADAQAQYQDRFDGGRPRWQLGNQDSRSERVAQEIDLSGGRFGTPAERLAFASGGGTLAEVFYPLPPTALIDDFRAVLWIRAARPCGPLGVRVRFPKLIDPATGQPLALVVVGSGYQQANTWEQVLISDVPRKLRLRQITLRSQFGSQVDLSDPYIDAITFNALQQPGLNQIWFDDLEITGHVPLQQTIPAQPPEQVDTPETQKQMASLASSATPKPNTSGPSANPLARTVDTFIPGKLLKILEYQGEPMDWLRSLGIDAVLMSRPPTDAQLTAASETGMKLICPAPPYVRNDWQGKLQPVIAWQVGNAIDRGELTLARQRANVARALPPDWQRPIVMTVLEGWQESGTVGDVFIRELPTALRNVTLAEGLETVAQAQQAMGRPLPWLISLELQAPEGLRRQLSAAARTIGAPEEFDIDWHDLWLRTAGALRSSPRGIVFRSSRALDSGEPTDHQRATALRMVCHWLAAMEPLVAGAIEGAPAEHDQPDYLPFTLVKPDSTLMTFVAQGGRPSLPRAGEGRVLKVKLLPNMRSSVAFRLSGPVPERIQIDSNAGQRELSIISPDLVENILFIDQPELIQQFLKRWQALMRTVAADRWQLVYAQLSTARSNWQSAASLLPQQAPPIPLLLAASNSLQEAQVAMQSNNWVNAASLLRRADAFQLRSSETLIDRLFPEGPPDTSLPTLQTPSSVYLHIAWPPALGQGQWKTVPVPGATFEDLTTVQTAGWTHDRRLEEQTHVALELKPVSTAGPQIQKQGMLRVAAWPRSGQSLRGGYEGTTLRVRSPMISGVDGTWVRIDTLVRTPLGFGGPEEGLLIYDSIGGSELGRLMRGGGGAKTLRLYRYVPEGQQLQMFFEVLGAGEAMIEQLRVEAWIPNQPAGLLSQEQVISGQVISGPVFTGPTAPTGSVVPSAISTGQ